MGEIRCFWVAVTDRQARSLRRYVSRSDANCPASHGYHNASVPIDQVVMGDDVAIEQGAGDFASDPRWPTHCECGYEFQETDPRQVFHERIYRCEADGREWQLRELPPGAMYDATWYRDESKKAGPDGINLCVCLPPNGGLDYWFVDGAASNGPGWTRTGTVPNVTANPSILTPRYHGWLRDGVLVEC